MNSVVGTGGKKQFIWQTKSCQWCLHSSVGERDKNKVSVQSILNLNSGSTCLVDLRAIFEVLASELGYSQSNCHATKHFAFYGSVKEAHFLTQPTSHCSWYWLTLCTCLSFSSNKSPDCHFFNSCPNLLHLLFLSPYYFFSSLFI